MCHTTPMQHIAILVPLLSTCGVKELQPTHRHKAKSRYTPTTTTVSLMPV
ncbi:MAG: hypothetical protein U0V04_07350 [Spirosomataceae bacterium]